MLFQTISFKKDNVKGHAISTIAGATVFLSALINTAVTAWAENGAPLTKEGATAAVVPAVAELIGATVVGTILAFFGVKR